MDMSNQAVVTGSANGVNVNGAIQAALDKVPEGNVPDASQTVRIGPIEIVREGFSGALKTVVNVTVV
jgi:hypothetical protein